MRMIVYFIFYIFVGRLTIYLTILASTKCTYRQSCTRNIVIMIRVYPDPPPTAPTHTKPRLDKHVLLLKLNHYQHANDNPCLQSGSLTTKSSTAKTGASSFIRRMATLTNRCRILWDHSGANTMRNHRQNSVQLQNNLANRVDINEMLIEAVP